MILKIEVAPGELIDKISILEIKLERLTDPQKLKNVRHEYEALAYVLASGVPDDPAVTTLRSELKAINETIWEIEDRIRDHECRQDFGPSFIQLARSVYITNDCRAGIKRQINEWLGSQLIEEKSYTNYGPTINRTD